ncbi:hypothetical protein [Rhodoblastus sp.]|uniref:hypothetical protein n=1 Tax=Rhodoblastus sp. TaxID=1962975 RepID=UPI0035AFC23C
MADEEVFPGKLVCVMGENGASGAWNRKYEDCDAGALPISPALRERLEAWCGGYGDIEEIEFEQGCADWGPYAAEGLAIARAVKAELRDWTVFYYDEAKARMKPPETARYEILD